MFILQAWPTSVTLVDCDYTV